jgi:hypothetical protein
MRSSIVHLNARSTPEGEDAKRHSGPVACAVFIAALAVGVTGGALWLTSAVVHSNAEAAAMILYEP